MAAIRVFVYDRSQFPVAFLYCSFIKRQWIPLNSCLDFSHLTSMYIAISHHSISRPRSLFFSSPLLPWMDISIYHQKPSSFFLILSDFSPIFFFFYWIRSWIIQKKGYILYCIVCVCIYSPDGWMPLLYRMDVCVYTGGRVKRPVGAWRV